MSLDEALYIVTRRNAGGSQQGAFLDTLDRTSSRARSAPPRSRSAPPLDHPVKRRRSFMLTDEHKMGERAIAARAAASGRRWIDKFVQTEFPESQTDQKLLGANKFRVYKAMRTINAEDKSTAIKQCASRSLAVQNGRRRRHSSETSKFANPCIREELFAWFLDTLQNVKCRLSAFIILSQAHLIASVYLDGIQKAKEEGRLDESFQPVIPKFTNGWLYLWRREYGLSWRTVNLRFKVSWSKLKELICIFHINTLKIRWLHYYLCGERQILIMINCDEKPLYFTSAHDLHTLDFANKHNVGVVENMPMSRSRFTWKTRCAFPRLPDDGKKGACLFRGMILWHGSIMNSCVNSLYSPRHVGVHCDWDCLPSR